MDEERNKKIYVKLIQKTDPEDPVIRDRVIKAWAKWSNDTGDAVLNFNLEFAACITGGSQQERFKDATTLVQALETESNETHTHVATYAGWICLWNMWFRQSQIKLKMPPILAAPALAMAIEIANGGWDDDAGFKQFCLTAPSPHREIYDMREAFRSAGLPLTDVYTAMHFLQQHSLPISKLKPSTATDIHYLSRLAPPLTPFAGYADWGPGNNKNPVDNKKNHFLKHVLDAHPEENLPWQGECGVWWRKLDIKLTRKAAGPLPGSVMGPMDKDFPEGEAGVLPFDKVAKLVGLVKLNGGWPLLLLNQLISDYQDKYTNTAITMSQAMTGIIVHTDAQGGKVLMMGLNGDFFIGGRMEGAVLGISTCFVPKPEVDKTTLNQANKIWQVSPL